MGIFDGLFGSLVGGALGGQGGLSAREEHERQIQAGERTRAILQQQAAQRAQQQWHSEQTKSPYDDGDVIDIDPVMEPLKLLKEGRKLKNKLRSDHE